MAVDGVPRQKSGFNEKAAANGGIASRLQSARLVAAIAGSLCGDGRQAQAMRALFRVDGAAERHPAVELWWDEHQGSLGAMARRWFEAMRHCGDDVREVLHDGQPTACVGGAAFAYVDAFTSHVNVGFFQGAELPDPHGLLEGAGKFMRHVKLRPGEEADVAALSVLIDAAYADVKARLAAETA